MTARVKTSTREEVVALARRAADGYPHALRDFARLAKLNGYQGRAGGWIYLPPRYDAVCQGWQNLAVRIADGWRLPMAPETALTETPEES